jgi:hypothetical protein
MVDRVGGATPAPLDRAWWLSDSDDEDSLDDMFVKNCDVHIERMSSGFYWIGIYVDGEIVHVDVHSKRKIKARLRK